MQLYNNASLQQCTSFKGSRAAGQLIPTQVVITDADDVMRDQSCNVYIIYCPDRMSELTAGLIGPPGPPGVGRRGKTGPKGVQGIPGTGPTGWVYYSNM